MIQINDLTYRIDGRILFDQATISLPDRTKAGLVGRNGTGKSTLFRLLKGEITAESGGATIREGLRVGSVEQEAPGGETLLLDLVLAADAERAALLAEAETAQDPTRIADIQTRLADIEAHSAEARAAEILIGLGFSHPDLSRPCGAFSGGWRMRAALACVLFARPDLLLLDEPTNYLDLEGALWLETHLRRTPGGALIISHDRDLLNAAVDKIVHLREGKLFVTNGGYDEFERQLAERQRLQLKLRERQDDERRRLQAFVDRFRAKASKARQAQSRVKRLEKMQPVATLVDNPVAPFIFPDPARRMAPPLIRMEDVTAGYDPERPILKDVSLRLDPDDRIGLLGRNGAGKTTLAKLLTGALAPASGLIKRHKKLEVAYFAQHQVDALNVNESAADHIRALLPDATEAERRARLGSFGLAQSKADTPAGDLSGGEKARLLLNLIMFAGPHVLILDEPTNHLDMDSRAALADAINGFEGAVILISHDRALIDRCVDRLWLVADGAVSPFDDDLDAYRRLVSGRGQRSAPSERAGAAPASRPALVAGDAKQARRRALADVRARLAPLREEVARWEKEMARLGEVLGVIDKGLASPSAYAQAPEAVAALAKKRARAAELLAEAEERWLEAGQALETAEADAANALPA